MFTASAQKCFAILDSLIIGLSHAQKCFVLLDSLIIGSSHLLQIPVFLFYNPILLWSPRRGKSWIIYEDTKHIVRHILGSHKFHPSHLLKSPTMTKPCFFSLIQAILTGPNKSMCRSSSGLEVKIMFLILKEF